MSGRQANGEAVREGRVTGDEGLVNSSAGEMK